jgi:gamma-glutamyltranspeptidase / glutathione hydrolase
MNRAVRRVAVSMLLAITSGSRLAEAQARPDVQGAHAAVVADHPLAAVAGAEVLRRGGNAVDAAITMAAVLAVVRPHMNGLGGDAFLLIRDGRSGRVTALNGSGRAGSAATAAAFRARGHDAMPSTGILSVTVPGAVRAWSDALRRHGTISWQAALSPAIELAASGFPVSDKLAADLAAARRRLEGDAAMAAVFLPGGRPPAPGDVLRQADLARSLKALARDGADALYTGDLAAAVIRFMRAERGFITAEDLAAHSSTWQQPIATSYHDHTVLAFPPNSQGAALLMQMNMARMFDLQSFGHNTPEYVHTLVEIKKLAFAERDRHIADPTFTDVPLEALLSAQRARELLEQWSGAPLRSRTLRPDAGVDGDALPSDGDGDTVFLGVVDEQGNAVALIQSLYNSFGSARMVPGTGIVLHNRGALFTLEDGHVNVVAPRKRPYHTLAPAMALTADGNLAMVLGTPGSDGQTQTLLQVFNNIVLFGMSPQRAVEAPRWRSWDDGRLQIEVGVPEETRAALGRFGHQLRLQTGLSGDLGGAQVILVRRNGVKAVGADPRREAYGIAW